MFYFQINVEWELNSIYLTNKLLYIYIYIITQIGINIKIEVTIDRTIRLIPAEDPLLLFLLCFGPDARFLILLRVLEFSPAIIILKFNVI